MGMVKDKNRDIDSVRRIFRKCDKVRVRAGIWLIVGLSYG